MPPVPRALDPSVGRERRQEHAIAIPDRAGEVGPPTSWPASEGARTSGSIGH